MQIQGKSMEVVNFHCHYHTCIIYNVHQMQEWSEECLFCQNDQKIADWEMGWEDSVRFSLISMGHFRFHWQNNPLAMGWWQRGAAPWQREDWDNKNQSSNKGKAAQIPK